MSLDTFDHLKARPIQFDHIAILIFTIVLVLSSALAVILWGLDSDYDWKISVIGLVDSGCFGVCRAEQLGRRGRPKAKTIAVLEGALLSLLGIGIGFGYLITTWT